MNIVMSLLSNNGYIIVNKEIIKTLGLYEAILLGEMCGEYTYWEKENRLDTDGYFFSTRENIEENTGLSPYQQRQAMNNLIEKGLLITKKVGMPFKIWYSFDMDKLYEMFVIKEKCLTTSSKETSQQDIKKLEVKELKNFISSEQETLHQDVNKLDINNINKNINKKESEQKKEYVEKVYLTENNFNSLTCEYGEVNVNKFIEELSLYKKSTGKVYEDDYSTIVRWIKREKSKNKTKFNYEQREYPEGFFEQFYANNQFNNSI